MSRDVSSIVRPKVGAIIVLYIPNPVLLERLIDSLKGETELVFIIDNTPEGKAAFDLSQDWFDLRGITSTYQPLGDNYGIAEAQNIGINLAIKSGCDHVILFDQDSAIAPNMVNDLLNAEHSLLQQSVKVGAIGPLFLDEKTNEYSKTIRHGLFFVKRLNTTPADLHPVQADYLISSGSLIRTEVLKTVGLMREDLFIDWVDIEWGLRANKCGYTNFVIPNAIMRHILGDGFVNVGSRTINLHNDIRNYYIVRNACHLFLDPQIDKRWRMNIAFKIPAYVVFYALHSKTRLKAFKLLIRACLDGFSGRLGKAF